MKKYNNKRSIILFCIWFLPLLASGQNFIGDAAFSPDLSFNIKLNDRYTINSKIESFLYFYDTDQSADHWQNYYDGTDIQIFITRKLNPFQRVALGYQLGTEPASDFSHRFIQQFSWVNRPVNLVLGHRLRTDQTLEQETPVRIRLRYRISLEIPLQGQALDPREFFILTSAEAIGSTQQSQQDLETRFVLQGGYLVKAGNKLQWGFDFRSRYNNDFMNNRLLVKLGWGINF
ncbi:MAG: DUF2490 domain-containing protein [Bacteroidales bacterium]